MARLTGQPTKMWYELVSLNAHLIFPNFQGRKHLLTFIADVEKNTSLFVVLKNSLQRAKRISNKAHVLLKCHYDAISSQWFYQNFNTTQLLNFKFLKIPNNRV